MKKSGKIRWMAGMLAFVLTATTLFNAGVKRQIMPKPNVILFLTKRS